jgi:thiol-disulfide isomerase/thioredoxin
MAVTKSTDADFAQLLQANEKAIVKYYADWCGSCKLFAPKFRRLSENENYEGIAFIDINAEENQEARKLAGVDNLPFIAVFKNGQLIEGRATGKEEAVVEMLSAL